MRVFVTGASGQLGYAVCRELTSRGIEHIGVSSKELNITDSNAVEESILMYRPDTLIHCAAYTNVDQAEREPELAFQTNCDGTYYIAKVCAKLGIKVGYISTDYVFPGTGSDFQEIGDQTGPLNVYGSSKLAGEEAIKTLLRKYFIVRTSWVFGKHGKNFVQSMLRLAENHCQLTVVSDQIGSPTYTEDLAALLCDMMQTEKYGVYHATNEGTCSWAEFAKEIFKIAGKHVIVIPVTSQDYGSKTLRPLNSKLSKHSLDAAGFHRLPTWQDALQRYLLAPSEL